MESFELEINKSRFIAYKLDLNSIEDVKPFLEKLKKEHKKARHVCYAYVFNKDTVNFISFDMLKEVHFGILLCGIRLV